MIKYRLLHKLFNGNPSAIEVIPSRMNCGEVTYGKLVTMREKADVACFNTLSWHSSGGTRDKIGVTRKEHSIFVRKLLGEPLFALPITQLADNYNFIRK
jgi:hypothetical protein